MFSIGRSEMWSALLQVLLFTTVKVSSENENQTCTAALGMESRTIPDKNIKASSVFPKVLEGKHDAANGRLRFQRGNGSLGAWAAATNDQNQWLQVDLGTEMAVTGVATQGRQDHDQWVKSYSLSYSLDGRTFNSYQNYKTFTANTDRNTVVKHTLPTTVMARYVRIHPRSWREHISMRAEFYGCTSEKTFPQPILTSTLFDKDKVLADHVIDTAMVSSVEECSRKCFNTRNCVSINFEYLAQNMKTCEINNSTKEIAEESFVSRYGFVYYG